MQINWAKINAQHKSYITKITTMFFVKLGGLGRYIVRHCKAIGYKIKYFIFGQVPQSSEESSVLCAV